VEDVQYVHRRDVARVSRGLPLAAKDYPTLAPAAWAAARQLDKPEKKDRARANANDL
jgi:hypothetical protein